MGTISEVSTVNVRNSEKSASSSKSTLISPTRLALPHAISRNGYKANAESLTQWSNMPAC